jgi:psp operon transcriptional activator
MSHGDHGSPMLGESTSFLIMQEQVSRAAALDKPVLVIGERGTGKELVAARLHYLSRRWQQAFLKVNCAALTDTLLESQLFGHEAGAFTGASRQQKGYFERADQGTLFLDEIASTSGALQEKLLRIVEYGEFERLGGGKPLQADVRLVAATNVDLPQLAASGGFREDLLDRLAFDVITLPPLRERREDIPLLARHFAIGMTKELGRAYFPGFTKAASKALLDYAWPGNIRELKNVIERSVYRMDDSDQPISLVSFDPFASPYRPAMGKRTHSPTVLPAAASPPARGVTEQSGQDFKRQVEQLEKDLLNSALQRCQYNQRKAASLLGLSYDQLRGYLRKYQLREARESAADGQRPT